MAVASQADHIVAVVGDTVGPTGEGRSTATLELMVSQIALLDALQKLDRPLVVVLLQGRPSTLPASEHGADAIVQAFTPGMRGGRAIAELLLGRIEPSGRLPLSIPAMPDSRRSTAAKSGGITAASARLTTRRCTTRNRPSRLPSCHRHAPNAQPRW
ncbi:glycoside hydrolase family 3 C-terminal domain-containing protein [Streptomyces sp. NPDC005374]|uniref:glycoside hydrolase family 3 protein n=1 Tax=Streptomyces sp. NPDC005374 TaxID=3364713 RepID=UPI0036785CDA